MNKFAYDGYKDSRQFLNECFFANHKLNYSRYVCCVPGTFFSYGLDGVGVKGAAECDQFRFRFVITQTDKHKTQTGKDGDNLCQRSSIFLVIFKYLNGDSGKMNLDPFIYSFYTFCLFILSTYF